MNVKTSVFVICVKTIIYLLLYNLHDCTFNVIEEYHIKKQLTLVITTYTDTYITVNNMHRYFFTLSKFKYHPSEAAIPENIQHIYRRKPMRSVISKEVQKSLKSHFNVGVPL